MIKKKYLRGIALALTLVSALSLSGCSEKILVGGKTDYAAELKADELSEGIYIYTSDGKFYQCNNYGQSYSGTTYQANSSRVCWYTDDEKFIPTVYADDRFIYMTKGGIPDNFVIEQFVDLGYTVGTRNMVYDTSQQGISTMLNDALSISNYYSVLSGMVSANDSILLTELNGSPITQENLTYAGTFAGLEKDKKYRFSMFKGTYYGEFDAIADTRVFASYSTSETLGYTRTKDNYVIINLSDSMQEGYYNINDTGMFYRSLQTRGEGENS